MADLQEEVQVAPSQRTWHSAGVVALPSKGEAEASVPSSLPPEGLLLPVCDEGRDETSLPGLPRRPSRGPRQLNRDGRLVHLSLD